jgi:hypothetical protein
MNKNNNRYVAHLDILGMSSIVTKNADDAWCLLSDLVAVRDQTNEYAIEFLDDGKIIPFSEIIQMVTFSDTIVLFTKSDSDLELRCMIILITEMFHKAMCRCVPVRVGLSFGKFYFNLDKSMYAGPALIEAYHVGEAAQWLGIVFSESVQDKATALNIMSGSSKVVVEWVVPLKNGSKTYFVVNWPAVFANDFKVEIPLSVAQFYQAFEETFGVFENLPCEVRVKYENTVNFINVLLKN